MSSWNPNKDQWGGQPYEPVYQPGPQPQYGGPSYAPPPPNNGYSLDQKSPYEGGRFAPKKRINDPIFLVLFILQVSRYMTFIGQVYEPMLC